MTDEESIPAVVLAGGYSRRFGETDKALADLAGQPMIRRVADRLAPAVDDVVVNCRDGQLEALREALSDAEPAVRFVTDPVPDRGPLAGVRAAFESLESEYAAVVACDMPFADPGLVERLRERAHGRDAAVVRSEEGWYQTTHAVYRVDATAAACARALGSGDAGLRTALEDLDWVAVDGSALAEVPPSAFESVDTREGLREAEDRLVSDRTD